MPEALSTPVPACTNANTRSVCMFGPLSGPTQVLGAAGFVLAARTAYEQDARNLQWNLVYLACAYGTLAVCQRADITDNGRGLDTVYILHTYCMYATHILGSWYLGPAASTYSPCHSAAMNETRILAFVGLLTYSPGYEGNADTSVCGAADIFAWLSTRCAY